MNPAGAPLTLLSKVMLKTRPPLVPICSVDRTPVAPLPPLVPPLPPRLWLASVAAPGNGSTFAALLSAFDGAAAGSAEDPAATKR